AVRLAFDTLERLACWLDRLRPLAWETVLLPTPSRGRSLRNLTVNVFHPFELLPAAWQDGEFPWEPERDAERETALHGRDELLAYAGCVHAAWTDFVLAHERELGERDPLVSSPRGALRYSALLDAHVSHLDFHL